MKDFLTFMAWAIGIVGLIFFFAVMINQDAATDNGNTRVGDFKYNGSSYYIYLDDDLNSDGELDITIRRGIHRSYIMSIDMKPDGTTNDIIKFFKHELNKEIAEDRKNDSLVDDWKAKQKITIERLKAGN